MTPRYHLRLSERYVFYDINGWTLDAEDSPAYDLVIAVAEGKIDVPDIGAAFEGWSRPLA